MKNMKVSMEQLKKAAKFIASANTQTSALALRQSMETIAFALACDDYNAIQKVGSDAYDWSGTEHNGFSIASTSEGGIVFSFIDTDNVNTTLDHMRNLASAQLCVADCATMGE
jgi:hypothetical protein